MRSFLVDSSVISESKSKDFLSPDPTVAQHSKLFLIKYEDFFKNSTGSIRGVSGPERIHGYPRNEWMHLIFTEEEAPVARRFLQDKRYEFFIKKIQL